jgi:hypothetical protein
MNTTYCTLSDSERHEFLDMLYAQQKDLDGIEDRLRYLIHLTVAMLTRRGMQSQDLVDAKSILDQD